MTDFDHMPLTEREEEQALVYSLALPPEKRKASVRLSDILKYQFDQPFYNFEGEVITAKEYLGILIMRGALTGRVEFPDGRALILRPKEWLQLSQWVYDRIDGRPKQAVDFNDGNESKIQINYVNDWRKGRNE